MRNQLLQSLLLLAPATAALSHEARVAQVLAHHGVRGFDRRAAAGEMRNTSQPFVYETDFDGVTWDNRNWRIQSTVLDQGHYQSRGSVANGYFGINVASAGPFFELDTPVDGDVINGWPLFSRRQSFSGIAGFWDSQPTTNGTNFEWLNQYGGESPISGIPHWSGLVLDLGDGAYLDASVDNKTISKYRTVYDYKAGLLTWTYTWSPSKKLGSFDVTYSLFVNKFDVNQAAVRMTVRPSKDVKARVVNLLEGYAAVRTDFVKSGTDGSAIYSAVRPVGISNVTAYVYAVLEADSAVDLSSAKLIKDEPYIYANDSTIAQAVSVDFKAGENVTVTKFVGVASTDAFSDPRTVAKNAAMSGKRRGYDDAFRSHVSEWAQVMPDDSIDDFTFENGTLPNDPFIIESAILAVVNPYYILQNTVGPNAVLRVDNAPVNTDGISVGGLTSDSYAGFVFWDMDTWMSPGITAAFPQSAQRFTNYRVKLYPQAKRNIKTAYTGSKNKTHFSDDAALYPWTSGRFGNGTGTGPVWDYEYHLNTDICIALVNEWISSGDDKTWKETYFPIYNSIATAMADLLQKNGSKWTLTNMTDPDEYANHVDAGGFTMASISQTLTYANLFRKQLGKDQNDTWADMAENVLLLRQNDVTLEYTTMNNSVEVKQADVVLNTYPLDYTRNYAPSAALNDLDYYALKQSPDGPAMTYAIFSIVANEVSPSGCSAYTYAQYSYSPYLRGPFHQLSEQLIDDFTTNGGTHPAFPFLTGHGGANQVVLFGYLGLRLVPDDKIHIDPNLPPQIPQVKYRTFYWHGWPISAMSNYTHTTISRATTVKRLDTADTKYSNSSIQLIVGTGKSTKSYKLPADGTKVVVANRQVGTVKTLQGNLIQCEPVQSNGSFVPGQFPISVNDGAASTKWQPEFANNISSVTIAIPESSRITGFYFDWAQSPPTNATVLLHDKKLSQDFGEKSLGRARNGTDNEVVARINVTISEPWTAKDKSNYVIGLQGGNTTNFTFAEPVRSRKFATLFIQGNQALGKVDVKYKNGTGATVAEWGILSDE